MAPSPGFDFTGLVVSGAGSRPVSPLRSLGPSHSGVCAMRVGVPPCFLAHYGAPWLMALRSGHCRIPAGLASMDGPLLVSAVESQLCECPFVARLAQGCIPLLRPFALLLAFWGGVPSGSLLRFRVKSSQWGHPSGSSLSQSSIGTKSPPPPPGVWLESSRWGHPVGSSLSQISMGTKTLCAPSLVVGAKPSLWGHPFQVVWRFSAHSIGTKASSVRLSFVASRWVSLRVVCVFLTLDRNEVYFG